MARAEQSEACSLLALLPHCFVPASQTMLPQPLLFVCPDEADLLWDASEMNHSRE